MSQIAKLGANLAGVSVLILGLAITIRTVQYVDTQGLNATSFVGVTLGTVYAAAFVVVAYFDFKRKSRALAISVLIAGFAITNALSGLGEGLPVNVGVADLVQVIVSLVAIVASLAAYSSLRSSATPPTSSPRVL